MLVGALDGEEPLYLDLRWARTEADLSHRHPQFARAVARLSAAIRGRNLDEIFGDDVREQRRTRRFLWIGIGIMLLATVFAGWRWWGEFLPKMQRRSKRESRRADVLLLSLRCAH